MKKSCENKEVLTGELVSWIFVLSFPFFFFLNNITLDCLFLFFFFIIIEGITKIIENQIISGLPNTPSNTIRE